ncbi:MAG: GIY-YIG nuclease family protein [Patescibacteria group bacterium]
MFFVYVLQSGLDGSLYIGQTSDVEARLQRHNSGHVRSTKRKRPWGLLGAEAYETRDKARWREYSIKRNASEKRAFVSKFLPSSFNG